MCGGTTLTIASTTELFKWSAAAIDAAARVICPRACTEPVCPCGNGCRLIAQLALAAALETERDSVRDAADFQNLKKSEVAPPLP